MRSLVTGAANGLGLALTRNLLTLGEVVGVDVDGERLEELAQRNVDRFEGRMCDLSDPRAVSRLADRLEGPFDIAVLNAGISATGRFARIPVEAYERLVRVNVTAPLLLAQRLVGDGLMAQKSTIVFISSLSHVTGYPGASVYAATKDAVAIYAKSVRRPFRAQGVRVTCVFPGPVRTEHGARHAPPGSKASGRMAPERLARIIVKGARRGERVLYPGGTALTAYTFGSLVSGTMTRLMRRIILDRLDREVY